MLEHAQLDPRVQSTHTLPDPRTPLERLRRTELVRKLHAAGIEIDPSMPKEDILADLARRRIGEKEILSMRTAAPEEMPRAPVGIMQLRKAVQATGKKTWPEIMRMRRPDLEAFLAQ